MDKKALEAFAREAAKSIKTESDIDDFRKMLTKVTVEIALNAELYDHFGYENTPPNLALTPVMATWTATDLLDKFRLFLDCSPCVEQINKARYAHNSQS